MFEIIFLTHCGVISGCAVNRQAITMQLIQSLIIGCGLALITRFVGTEVLRGHLRTSDFVLIDTYILQFVMPLSYIGHILQQVRKGFVDMSDSIALLELKPEVIDSPSAIDLHAREIAITFVKVSFSYDPKREILHDITFSVPSGKTIALVGPTGSGKSTIARLLFRMYEVEKGAIKINKQDILSVAQHSLHALIGVVSQDTVLFNNTLYYNIAYGNPLASKDEVLRAAHSAQLDGFIAQLPAGLETRVGERGLMVSGGEKLKNSDSSRSSKKSGDFSF